MALLAFLLGIWVWDHYFGREAGWPPGTEQVALLKIDRDLRLAEAMENDPAWLRWLAGADSPEPTARQAQESLERLARDGALGPAGVEAFAVLEAEALDRPAIGTVSQFLQGSVHTALPEIGADLARGGGSWWQARLLAEWGGDGSAAGGDWRAGYLNSLDRLRTRAIAAGSSIWLIGLAGLAFLPGAVKRLREALRDRPRGYSGAWPPALGLIVFMAATLAWIGFSLALDLGLAAVPEIPPALVILLDAAARLLPALIAVGLLFRRPGHASRVLGLGGGIFPGTLLGVFSLLLVIDQGLRRIFHDSAADPTGGLSLMEAGMWGLVFAVISACIVAPVAEEILYRGVLFRSLANKLGVVASAVLSSGIFAMLHFYNSYGLASVAVFGFSCAIFYAATRSLLAVILLHALYNTSIKIPEWIIYHLPLGG